MVVYAYNEVLSSLVNTRDYIPDNLYESITDWLILGMQAGMRLSEWCQDKSVIVKTKTLASNIDGSSRAFILNYFYFSDKNNKRRQNVRNIHIGTAENVTITWSFKNIMTMVKN